MSYSDQGRSCLGIIFRGRTCTATETEGPGVVNHIEGQEASCEGGTGEHHVVLWKEMIGYSKAKLEDNDIVAEERALKDSHRIPCLSVRLLNDLEMIVLPILSSELTPQILVRVCNSLPCPSKHQTPCQCTSP
jgi:hypothetical protein